MKWIPDNGDGTYTNPIIYADYSDPDIIKVNNDYYLTASSFNCTPILPILHSKDLVNWKIVNHVALEIPLDSYKKVQHGKGIWAPTFQYHDKKVWLFVCTPDEGLFMTNTSDPKRDWAPLHRVTNYPGWIDPCVFWDDDGQTYLLHAFARSRVGFCSVLHLCKMTSDAREVKDEGRFIIDTNGRHHVIEGPRLFKRNGYYYITAPAGGIVHGYQLIYRSKNIYGPYEERIAIHEDEHTNGPRQGNFVKTDKGEDWFIHFQDLGPYGRVVNLQPVKWVDDWPIIGIDNDHDKIGEPVKTYKKPDVSKIYHFCLPQTSDDFSNNKLGLQWQWHANSNSNWYKLGNNNLTLYSTYLPERLLYFAPNLLLQKFPAPQFQATTKLFINHLEDNDMTGLIICGVEYHYLTVIKINKKLYLRLVRGYENQDNRIEDIIVNFELKATECIYLSVSVNEGLCQFSYGFSLTNLLFIGNKFKAISGKWIGAKVGIFAINTEHNSKGYSTFCYFNIE